MKMFQFRVWKLIKDRVVLNDYIHGGGVFIIVFKSDVTVVNN